jgi:hypothetical protein
LRVKIVRQVASDGHLRALSNDIRTLDSVWEDVIGDVFHVTLCGALMEVRLLAIEDKKARGVLRIPNEKLLGLLRWHLLNIK